MRDNLPSPARFNVLILLAIALHFVLPIRQLVYWPYSVCGVPLILLGVVLNVVATRQLQRRGTATEFHEVPEQLVVEGLFRISRNPVYLSGVVLLTGLAVLLGSLVAFAAPVTLFLILNWLYIPAEEELLAERFGGQYLEYKWRVRRWI